jgi:UPF0042 nucleotide-binding protein
LKDLRLVVLSGPSGAGKSTAIKALEDIGYFCVDNLPVALLPKFMELLAQSSEIVKVAVVVDVREREFLREFTPVFSGLKGSGYLVELVYLEASDDSLVRRFSETRRRHPLADSDSPLEGVLRERELLNEVKSLADKVVDTTYFNVHQLRDFIKGHFSGPVSREKMILNVVSFGFRYGSPADADIVMDVRFLPNPYFVDELRPLDGEDERVRGFVLNQAEARDFLQGFSDFLGRLIPLYGREGKTYLTVAIGCTGGRHRSVAIVDALAGDLAKGLCEVRIRHRDIARS